MRNLVVAVVGRPNVGKSTFFNYLAGRRISIVDDTPGVTRDRIYTEIEWRGKKFTLVDTGGIEPRSDDTILSQMRMQAEIAIDMADVVLLIVDVRVGLTATDEEVAAMLRKSDKPVIVVVNKCDTISRDMPVDAYEFYNLGFEQLHTVSSIHGLGTGDLLDAIYEYYPEDDGIEEDEDRIKVAVIGKPNAGKSSLINRIIGEDRVIVSEIAGTTRDAVDTNVDVGEDKFTFIDTAGVRKKSKIDNRIEKYSILRVWTAVDRADVCLCMIDATEGVTEQDTKIIGYAHDQGKALIFVINKWDLVEKETGTMEKYKAEVLGKLAYARYAPVLFISATTGQRVDKIYDMIKYVNEQASFRISTGMLNDFLSEAVLMVQPPSDKGRRLKIYYMTQVGVKPPTFVIFINDSRLMHFSYQRYLENQLRKSFAFVGTSIKFILRERDKDK